MLEKAIAPDETMEDMLAKLFRSEAQLWIVMKDDGVVAAMVTELVNVDHRLVCNIWALAGTGVNNWLAYLPFFEAWAMTKECKAITISRARPGWTRILKDYRVKTVSLEKEL